MVVCLHSLPIYVNLFMHHQLILVTLNLGESKFAATLEVDSENPIRCWDW